MKDSLSLAYAMKRRKKMAEGGEMESGYADMPEVEEDKGDRYDDLVDRILEKRQMMSEGGRVANGGDGDLEKMADGRPNNFDDLSLRDDLTSTYGDDDNSGDALGNAQEDADRHDIVARVMRSRAKRDRMPRPA